MTEPIRWGILGTGNIAHQFARGLADTPDATLVAVGSRSIDTANTFADEFDIERRHPTYEELADDDGVDAVYVATPHPFHRDNSILLLEHGKAVICEKPFTINSREAEEVMASFVPSTTEGIAPVTITFNNNSVGTIESHSWDFGDGETSDEISPVHTYSQPGE